METQQSFSFDRVTLKKIWHGVLIAISGACITWLSSNVQLIADLFKEYPTVAIFATALCGVLVNMGKEWLKGEEVKLP